MNDFREIIFYACGFIFGIVYAHPPIHAITMNLRRIWKLEYPGLEDPPYIPILPGIVGYVERLLYIIAFSMGQPIFIGIWLTLKTAARWEEWTKPDPEKIPGRATYNVFLVGSGLSILYAFIGWQLIYLGSEHEYIKMILAPLGLVIFSYFVNHHIEKKLESVEIKTTK